MIISSPEELRLFLPSHTYRNLDPIQGFLNNSEADFLRERIGQPLLDAIRQKYAEYAPAAVQASGSIPTVDTAPDLTDSDDSSTDAIPTAEDITPWRTLITLCQRCIVYDAFARAADIKALSDNDMGINVAESENFDAANDKRVDRYKQALRSESHAASNRLLIQLEDWQSQVESYNAAIPDASTSATAPVPDASASGSTGVPTSAPSPDIQTIVSLWQHSNIHYLVDGLLFNTATEFNRYVDIYDSRDRFITLLPDIRYCQELHIEAEIGIDLLVDLKQKHRAKTLNGVEQRAYVMLQRTLSLYVEARNKMFNRPASRDEAAGYMALTLDYIRKNQSSFSRQAITNSPLFDSTLWPIDGGVPTPSPSTPSNPSSSTPLGAHLADGPDWHCPKTPNPNYPAYGGDLSPSPSSHSCGCRCGSDDDYNSNMHITSLI